MSTAKPASLDQLPTGPGNRILRPEEVQAWQDGYSFLATAKRETERMRDAARRAYASEYARGYEEGKGEGQAEAARLVSDAAVKVDRYLSQLEGEVAALAVDVVRRVLGEFDTGMLVAHAAAKVVAEMRRAKYIRVAVHPDAVEAVHDELAAVTADARLGLTLEVESDRSLGADACIVSTEAAVVDASIGTQLAAIASAVAGRRERGR